MLSLILCFQYLPLLFQIFINIKTGTLVNLALLFLQGIVTALILFIEIGQFCRSSKVYLSSIWNMFDLGYVAINCVHIFFRFLYIEQSIITNWDEYKKAAPVEGADVADESAGAVKVFTTMDKILLIVNFATLIISSFKIITMLRMFESIASLVQLLQSSFRDVKAFLIFLMLFVLIFGAYY